MTLIQMKCPNCGGNLQINGEGIYECKYCHEKFISKQNFLTNILEDPSNNNMLENETKQCKVLLMMLNNFDLSNLKEKALQVLEINPQNELASMIYHLDFEFENFLYGDISTYSFKTSPITDFFEKHKGSIDVDTAICFLTLLYNKRDFCSEDFACTKAILTSLETAQDNNQENFSFYKKIIKIAKTDSPNLSQLKKIALKTPKGLTTFLLTNNEYLAADVAEYKKEVKSLKRILEKSHNNFLKSITEALKQSKNLSDAEKKKLKFYAYWDKLVAIIVGIIAFIVIFCLLI